MVPTPATPITDDDDFEGELAAEDLETMGVTAFDDKLREFLAIHNTEELSPSVYLYKFDHPTTGESKSLVCKYENEIPDAHTVGLSHGSGRYLILVNTPKTKTQKQIVRGYRFRIHPHYDSLRMNTASNGPPFYTQPRSSAHVYTLPPGAERGEARGGASEGLAMVKEVISILAPLMMSKKDDGGGMLNMGKFMAEQYSSMGEVMKHNLIESSKMVADAQRARLNGPSVDGDFDDAGDDGDEGGAGGIIQQILPFLQSVLPQLLGQGPVASATAASIKALPQFGQVVNNPAEVRQLVAYLDRVKGKEATDKVLKRFKISRPK
jgi:hypothetical protein